MFKLATLHIDLELSMACRAVEKGTQLASLKIMFKIGKTECKAHKWIQWISLFNVKKCMTVRFVASVNSNTHTFSLAK